MENHRKRDKQRERRHDGKNPTKEDQDRHLDLGPDDAWCHPHDQHRFREKAAQRGMQAAQRKRYLPAKEYGRHKEMHK